MACEQYRKLAIDAALGALSSEMLAQFKTHCASCAICEAEFRSVSELLASIDRGVADMVNVRPSDQFAMQITWRIAESADHPKATLHAGLSITACGFAVVALLYLLVTLNSPSPRDANSANGSAQVMIAGPGSSPSVAADPLARGSSHKPRPSHVSLSKSKTVRTEEARPAVSSTPEVIVPSQEWSAISRLAADAATGHVSVEPMSIAEVHDVEPTELKSSELPVFQIVQVVHRDAIDDSSSE